MTAIATQPLSAQANILLAQVREALARGDTADAEDFAGQLLHLQPDHEPSLAFLSSHARQRGDTARALDVAQQGLRLLPQSALLHFNLGATLAGDRRNTDAREALLAAIALAPSLLVARFWLGSVQERLGELEASLHTRMRTLAMAEREGFLMQASRLPAETRAHVDAAIAAVNRGREAALALAWQDLSARHSDGALKRIRAALDRHLGKSSFEPGNPRQRPSFLFIPGLPDLPWFEREEFAFLDAIEQASEVIRAELLELLADETRFEPYVDMPDNAPAAPAWHELNHSPRWSGYHLFRHGERVDEHCRRCPRTAATLESLPLLHIPGHGPEALFSVLRPGTHIPPHTGVINGRLTVHLPLIVPENCGKLVAGGQARSWQEGRCLVFDDSYFHEAWNDSAHTRVVLLFDIWNPHLGAAECEALTTSIVALAAFNDHYGGNDPMQES